MPIPQHCFLTITLSLGLFSAVFTATHVQADEADRSRILKAIETRLNDPDARQAAIEAGEDRAMMCKYCHGNDGNSLKGDTPNLAGQNPQYLLEQIGKFASGQRNDFVMSPLAANFTPEDMINIAIFYYSQPVKAQPIDETKSTEGKALFYSVCKNCHGAQGHGNQKFARLAGQQAIYITKVLKAFRNNATNPTAKAESNRQSATMEGVAKNLSDEQIKAVAAYVAQLP